MSKMFFFFNSYPPYPRHYETLCSTRKESCQESWPLVPRPMFAANIPLRGKCLVTRRRSQHFFYSLEQTGDTLNSWASQLLLWTIKTFDISMPLWKWFTKTGSSLLWLQVHNDTIVFNLWWLEQTHPKPLNPQTLFHFNFHASNTSKYRMNCLCHI